MVAAAGVAGAVGVAAGVWVSIVRSGMVAGLASTAAGATVLFDCCW